ncbi:MAG: ATP-binding cassette domain-containing protein, partial [Verrucomicrobia bacterium]|nr:ATP-binding cassette domain-containing protein [Verrucomicrobiota bacterium]
LLVYWALNLPFLAEEIAFFARQYPALRSVTLRVLEPLGAPEEPVAPTGGGELVPKPNAEPPHSDSEHQKDTEKEQGKEPVGIALENVTVRAAGHTILEDVTLRIAAGEHVAIVGPSGAGKSSLVGLLLGWHRPARGELLVNGSPLDARWLERLRRNTAWVDPAVQLWNRSLLDNLCYGANGEATSWVSWVLQQADLLRVLQKLPDGLQTRLGEGGGLVSGGEGQRVRFGRGLLRDATRLVILDEPFRGLDREQRRALMERARAHWRGVTLLCITHDVGETLGFGRVLVLENGRVAEDGVPAALAQNSSSRYATLLAAERAVREQLWAGECWRRQWLEGGRLVERPLEKEPVP